MKWQGIEHADIDCAGMDGADMQRAGIDRQIRRGQLWIKQV